MIKNIVFDMGGVLIVWDTARMLSQLNLPQQDNELLNRELLRSVEWIGEDRGDYNEQQLEKAACAKLPEHLHEPVHRLVQWYRWFLLPMPGMAALVRELKGNGYGIYLLSNAGTNLRDYFSLIPGAEYFDGIMVSAEERQLKPSREIYERLYEKYSLNPAECWFTDDTPANIEGAMQAGMQGAVFHGDTARLRREMIAAGIRCREEAE